MAIPKGLLPFCSFYSIEYARIRKKHSETSQTLFTGLTLDRTTLCPMGSRRSGHRLMPTAVHASADKEKACSVHPLQVRGRPLVARRVGCGAKPCRELRRSMHSEQSGVLSWRMTYAWGAWLLRSSARRPLHAGQESPPLARLQTGRGYAHAP